MSWSVTFTCLLNTSRHWWIDVHQSLCFFENKEFHFYKISWGGIPDNEVTLSSHHSKLRDTTQLIQLFSLHNFYYSSSPPQLPHSASRLYSCLLSLSFKLWKQVSLFICFPWQCKAQRSYFVTVVALNIIKSNWICRLYLL